MSKCDYTKLKKEDLLKLPLKPFIEIKTYDCLLIVPTRRKHDSGWRLMAIVGCDQTGPIEIAGYCDDINLILPKSNKVYNKFSTEYYNAVHYDMILSNCIRFWSNGYKFVIGCGCSTTDVKLIKRENDE